MDQNNLLCAAIFENLVNTELSADQNNPTLRVIYDWYAPSNLIQLALPEQCRDKGMQSDSDRTFFNRHPRANPRFTSGCVIPKGDIAALYASAFYTPGILEVLQAMINPVPTNQDVEIDILPVPADLYGSPYAELVQRCIKSDVISLGLVRTVDDEDDEDDEDDPDTLEEDDGNPDATSRTVCMGGDAPISFVQALSPIDKKTLLREGDSFFVLAHKDTNLARLAKPESSSGNAEGKSTGH